MLTRDSELQLESLGKKLLRRQLSGSYEVTMETMKLLRNIISSSHWNNQEDVLQLVNSVLNRLKVFQPIELAVVSTSERLITFIKEEYKEIKREIAEDEGSDCSQIDDEALLKEAMKSRIKAGIQFILDEHESAAFDISAGARDHIHSNEIIMTIGKCKIVSQFLKEAARVRKFQVIVAETAPL